MLALALALAVPSLAAPEPADRPGAPSLATRMPFPPGFPQGFTLYAQVDDERQATVQRRYANATAWQAARAGLALPAGSVILVATHGAALDAASGQPLRDAQSRLVPGALRAYAGMQAEAGWGQALPETLRNGDWHYALFDATGQKRESMNHAECLACHRPQGATDYVFTLPALREAAAVHGKP